MNNAQLFLFLFFFNDTATTEIYTLSLHDALPISLFADVRPQSFASPSNPRPNDGRQGPCASRFSPTLLTSVEIGRAHVELQSRQYLVCRLLLEKKKKQNNN